MKTGEKRSWPSHIEQWTLSNQSVKIIESSRNWFKVVQLWVGWVDTVCPFLPSRYPNPRACYGVRTQNSIQVTAKSTTIGTFLVPMVVLESKQWKEGRAWRLLGVRVFGSGDQMVRNGSRLLHHQGSGSFSWFEFCFFFLMWRDFLCHF